MEALTGAKAIEQVDGQVSFVVRNFAASWVHGRQEKGLDWRQTVASIPPTDCMLWTGEGDGMPFCINIIVSNYGLEADCTILLFI